MSMPKLVPENHVAINEHFANFTPSERINRFGFAVMHAMCPNDMHYIGGSDQIIQEHLEAGGNVILAPYHQSNLDTPTTASIGCEPPFQLLRGDTIIPAKASIFRLPILGRFFPHMGGHPAFRGKDFAKDEAGILLREQCADGLIQLDIDYINNGGNVAIFPQGTRDKDIYSLKIPKIRPGIARIALGVNDPSKLIIVPAGIAYRSKFPRPNPVVVINRPFSPAGKSEAEVIELTRAGIQEAKDIAFEIAA